jgi:hypothetical protein
VSFADNFAWQKRFDDHVAEIIWTLRVRIASWEQDTRYNADWRVARTDNDWSVTERIRRAGYRDQYAGQITIRCYLPSGVPTEMHKMRDGYGDFGVYGFESEPGSDRLNPWVFYNTRLLCEYVDEGGRWYQRENRDGTRFAVFDIAELAGAKLGLILNSRGLNVDPWPPADGECRVCGKPSWQSDTVGPVHDCCSRVEVGAACSACAASAELQHTRWGWPGSFYFDQARADA